MERPTRLSSSPVSPPGAWSQGGPADERPQLSQSGGIHRFDRSRPSFRVIRIINQTRSARVLPEAVRTSIRTWYLCRRKMRMKFNKSGQLLLVSAASLLAAGALSACATLTVDFVYVTTALAAGPNNYGEVDVFEINSESGH